MAGHVCGATLVQPLGVHISSTEFTQTRRWTLWKCRLLISNTGRKAKVAPALVQEFTVTAYGHIDKGAPRERGQQRIAEQSLNKLVRPITEGIVAEVHLAPHESEQERLAVQTLDILKERIAKSASEQGGNRRSASGQDERVCGR